MRETLYSLLIREDSKNVRFNRLKILVSSNLNNVSSDEKIYEGNSSSEDSLDTSKNHEAKNQNRP